MLGTEKKWECECSNIHSYADNSSGTLELYSFPPYSPSLLVNLQCLQQLTYVCLCFECLCVCVCVCVCVDVCVVCKHCAYFLIECAGNWLSRTWAWSWLWVCVCVGVCVWATCVGFVWLPLTLLLPLSNFL